MDERPTILIVEDDRTLARGLEMNLELEGFRVICAADGQDGLRLALDEAPALILLDLMLPELGGFEVVAALRERARATPVLVLSARSEVGDKVEALALGADDFVTKPFNLRELVARIRARLRRPTWQANESALVRCADLEVDLESRQVHKAGEPVALTAREFDLLAFLVSHPGRVYSRDRLVEAVWHYDYEGTARTVDNFIRSLRLKLETDPTRPRHLVTVRGAGYRFED